LVRYVLPNSVTKDAGVLITEVYVVAARPSEAIDGVNFSRGQLKFALPIRPFVTESWVPDVDTFFFGTDADKVTIINGTSIGNGHHLFWLIP
jgi:hypothetical protein